MPIALIICTIIFISYRLYEARAITTKAVVSEKHPAFGKVYWVTFQFPNNEKLRLAMPGGMYKSLNAGDKVTLTYRKNGAMVKRIAIQSGRKP